MADIGTKEAARDSIGRVAVNDFVEDLGVRAASEEETNDGGTQQ
jgi:hypothetical protein